jgi:3-oxoacyl-[acyl-carrier-protein] synthase-3
MKKAFAHLKDISVYLPEDVIKNEDLATLYSDWSMDKIFEKTGIAERHIAKDSQTAGDMAFQAAVNLFTQGEIHKQDVDFIILCTQAPDYLLPTTACLLQHRLGISRNAGALDINLGCSGFVYCLSVAKGLVETGAARCVLLLAADTYSKFIHPMDKSVRTLFGDAATATAIIADENDYESLGPFVFGTDGSGAHNLIVEAGMSRLPKTPDTSIEVTDSFGNIRSRDNLYMNGPEIMGFSLREVPIAIDALLQKSGRLKEDIDFFVLHQANRFMLEALRKKLSLTEEKLPITMMKCGNTVSSSIPIALYELIHTKRLRRGHLVMLVGFGVGYSWAACMLNF